MSGSVDTYPIPTVCDYCGAKVIFTSNAEIYGREYGNGKCYKCTSCDSYVGVHTDTLIPLGRLANKELRELKKQCHALFDPAWKGNKNINRDKAYRRLANRLEIPLRECHFGWFDKETLHKCLDILRNPDWYKRISHIGMTKKQFYNQAVKACKATTCYHCGNYPKEYCNDLDKKGFKLSCCKEYYQLSPDEKLIVQEVTKV